jgi:hypothetical protein
MASLAGGSIDSCDDAAGRILILIGGHVEPVLMSWSTSFLQHHYGRLAKSNRYFKIYKFLIFTLELYKQFLDRPPTLPQWQPLYTTPRDSRFALPEVFLRQTDRTLQEVLHALHLAVYAGRSLQTKLSPRCLNSIDGLPGAKPERFPRTAISQIPVFSRVLCPNA